MRPEIIVGIVVIIIGIGAVIGFSILGTLEQHQQIAKPDSSEIIEQPQNQPPIPQPPKTEKPQIQESKCTGTAGCYTDYITRIVDGDTIHTATKKIRLSLTNTPESYEAGFNQATQFTTSLCPVGSKIIIDQDDLQRVDQYGRILAKVFCGEKILNAELLYSGHANILTAFCNKSEFSKESWATRFGCDSPLEIKKPIPQSCDPSYPDVCIPPYPPDLNCADIPYKKFKVVGSDPHRFDGDKDGIGCES